MAGPARGTQAERDLVRRCHSGLDVAAVHAAVLQTLRRLVPIDAAFFATADPETLLFTGAYADEPLGAATPMFLDNEFGGEDLNSFASLASGGSHVATLDGATQRNRLASPRYRDIMRPLGLGDELRAALVVGAECWGYLCLHREDRERGFTDVEAALVRRVGPHIAHALRQAVLLHGSPSTGAGRAPGVVLLSEGLDVVAITPEAEHLLSMIEGDGGAVLGLPITVYTVVAALLATERATAAPPSAQARTTVGRWLNVHASRLSGPGEARIAVVLEPAEARAALPRLLSAYGLTRRETEVTNMVLRGEPTRAIAGALFISPHTVQDHLKSIFDKIDVRSRGELVGRLLEPVSRATRGQP